jgi:hypothetical protein
MTEKKLGRGWRSEEKHARSGDEEAAVTKRMFKMEVFSTLELYFCFTYVTYALLKLPARKKTNISS